MAKSKHAVHLESILKMQDEGKEVPEIVKLHIEQGKVDAKDRDSFRKYVSRTVESQNDDPDDQELAEDDNRKEQQESTDNSDDKTEETKEPEKPVAVYKIPKEYKQLTERFTDQLFNLQVTVLELVGKSQDASAEAHKTLINQSKILQYVEDFGDQYKKASNDLELMTCELDGIIDNLKINARLRVWFFASAWLLSMAAALMAGYYVGRCLDPIALWYMVRALIIPGSFIAGAVLAIVVMICIQRKKNKNKKNDDEEE